ncbi:MAG TPA: DUF1499 domain-containing protein, partial [Devosia sp.]|nr:DUF1499 domain-containing protein [Devosia sp.]
TDFDAPPPLVSFVESRFIGPGERARIEAAYPNARSRNYPVDAVQMFGVVSDLLDSRGWEVRARREPQSPMDTGELNVIAANILGFRQEIVIRVAGAADGSTVAMRSASLFDFPDFGNNGRRIEDFLLDLDTQVTDALRNAPGQPADNADANDSADADN